MGLKRSLFGYVDYTPLVVGEQDFTLLDKASRNMVINIPKLETYIHELQEKISNLDFEGKRLVLDMLGTNIWLDGENVEVTGTIDIEQNGVTLPTNTPMFVQW